MALEELMSILVASNELSTLLGASIRDSKIAPTPRDGEGIGYNFIPLINDGCLQQSQFELKIINANLINCYAIKSVVDSLLICIGDNRLTDNILSCSQNGGGQYKDIDSGLFILQANYTITERVI